MSEQEDTTQAQPEELKFEVEYDATGSTVKFPDGEDPFADDTPDPEPETPAEPETPPTEGEPPSEPQAEGESQEGEPETPLILGKYKDHAALEEAHRQQEVWATQSAQRAAELERQLSEQAQRMKEQDEFISKAAPILEQLQNQPPVQIDPYAEPEEQERQRQAIIAQQVQAEVQKHVAQFEQQQKEAQVSQQQADWDRTRQEFYQAHPEVQTDQSLGWGIRRIFEEYGEDLSPSKDNLEVAYQLVTQPQVKHVLDRFNMAPGSDEIARAQEILADPSLLQWVSANPSSVEADAEGWEAVKQYAGLPVSLQNASGQATEAQKAEAQKAKSHAFVERGGSGAPAQAAPGKRNEAWAEIGGDLYDAEKGTTLGR